MLVWEGMDLNRRVAEDSGYWRQVAYITLNNKLSVNYLDSAGYFWVPHSLTDIEDIKKLGMAVALMEGW